MIELVVLGATLALAAGASGARVRRRIVAARTFERYARWRSHVYVPAARGSASPRVEGTKDAIGFTLDLVRVRGHIRTRASAEVAKGPGAKITIVQRGHVSRAMAKRDDDGIETGIASFDAAYRLHGMRPAEAREWLEGALAPLVCLDERRDVWLGSDGAKVTLLWAGVEKNPLLLDAARDLVVSLAAWHRPDAPYR
ncbi:MAG: hypothetical protein JST00_43175 [Deltaproteobacteria bacterium]|nr:hypothetical protein [Deltaproteobacteria bacterium]